MSQPEAVPEYVPPRAQLATVLFVRSLRRSVQFYGAMGFEVAPDEDGEAKLYWEGRMLVVRERPGLPSPPSEPPAGVRVIVHDVETYWKMAATIHARVIEPLHEADDGLRAFTVADPDGFRLRFATPRVP